MPDLHELWDTLDTSGESKGGFVRLRIPAVKACAAYAARSVSTGLSAFVIEMRTSELPSTIDLPEAAGVQLIAEAVTPGRSGRTRVVLALTNATFDREYRVFVNDVALRLSKADTESAAASTLHETFYRWLRFLRQRAGQGLTREQRVGLVGELCFLQLLLKRVPAGDALAAWKGCDSNHHDFSMPRGATEVKATTQTDARTIHVSNISQLEPPNGRPLFLFLLHLRASASGDIELPSLVQQVGDGFPESLRAKFENSLMACGYHQDLEEDRPEERYELISRRYFHVGDGFPRLPRAAIPSGVEGVTYKVALGACKEHEIKDEQVWNMLSGLGRDGDD